MKYLSKIITVLFFLLIAFPSQAAQLNYQAKVTDNQGQTLEDGNYHMKFKIWSTGRTGKIPWQEVHTGENRVKVEEGIFKANLGQINPLNFDFKEDSYYLSVVIGGKEEKPNWNSGISLVKKIKLADLTFKIETLGMDVLEEVAETAEALTKVGEPLEIIDLIQGAEGAWIFRGNVLTDSLIRSLSSPENALDFFDEHGDIVLTTASDKDFKIVLGSGKSMVNILVGGLKIGSKEPEILSGFELKNESAFISGDLGVAGKTYLGGQTHLMEQVFLSGQDIASQMTVLEPEAAPGDVVVAIIDPSITTQARLSFQANDRNILGVVSEKPAALLRSSPTGTAVAMTGIIKIKVSTENGIIKKGDFLTTSSLPGRAMKASWPGAGIVAKALEDFNGKQGMINALLRLGNYYQPLGQTLTVAKTGGNFTSIALALESIKDASKENPYLIKIEPGIYNERIIMKEWVDVVGAGEGLVKIVGEELPLVEGISNGRLEGVSLEISNSKFLISNKISNFKFQTKELVGIIEIGEGVLGMEIGGVKIEGGIEEISNSKFLISNKISNESITETTTAEINEPEVLQATSHKPQVGLVGILIRDSAIAKISNTEISGTDRGIVKIGQGKVEISHSNIRTNQADIQTLPEEAKISSSYNILAGTGYNFDIATSTTISSYADKYNTINKQGDFMVLDYIRESEEPALKVQQKGTGDIIRLSNIDRDLFAVDVQGVVTITPQNSSGESFKILSQSENVGLLIRQLGLGPAARFSGEVIVGPKQGEEEARLIFEGPGKISAGGYPISIGEPGDTVKLNIPEVKYEFPEKLRRDTIFLHLSEPRAGMHLLGNKNNSWQPEEEITILKLKFQYNVVEEDNSLQVVLFDSMENIILSSGEVIQENLGYYQIINDTPDEIVSSISPDEGLYIAVEKAKGVRELSIEVEYVYSL